MIAEVEALAAQLYGGTTSNAQRAEAERQLSLFSSNPEMLDQARMVLENSQQPYAQHMAATSMSKLLTANWSRFSAQQRIDMRQYVRFNPSARRVHSFMAPIHLESLFLSHLHKRNVSRGQPELL